MPRFIVNTNKLTINQNGFSFIELAIVLVIVSVLIGGFIGTVGSRIEITRRSDTVAQLNNIKDAMIGFAASQGRIPCPALAATQGIEAPAGGGACTSQHGFIPGVTLGLKGRYNRDNLLLDSWNNPIRYSVTNVGGFTAVNGMKTTGISNLFPNLEICASDKTGPGSSCGVGNSIITNAPFIILSLGKDGNEFVGTVAPDSDQGENSGEFAVTANAAGENIAYLVGSNRFFVNKSYSEEGSTAGFYDDIIVWESPFVLYSKLIEAGQLP